MASHIWLRTILIVRKETRCRHIGYSFRLTARVLLYVPSHRQDSTYHGLCYTSHGAPAGTRNSSMGPTHGGSIRRPIAPWSNALTTELHLAPHVITSVGNTVKRILEFIYYLEKSKTFLQLNFIYNFVGLLLLFIFICFCFYFFNCCIVVVCHYRYPKTGISNAVICDVRSLKRFL